MAIVVIVLVLVLFGLNEVTKKTSLKKIFYKREFSKQAVEIGEEFNITAIIENQNIFPVSFLHIIEQVPARLTYKFAKTEFEKNEYSSHEITMFLLPKQRVKRKYTVSFGKRGRYFFRDVTLYGGDFLGFSTVEKDIEDSHDIIVYPQAMDIDTDLVPYGSYYGDISVQRWIISDPILTVGIRDYTGCEPQKNIHWASSLRSGKLMVKNFDYTTDNRVMIVLNIESNRPFSSLIMGREIERCLSITRSLMEKFESMGIPYGFASNITSQGFHGGKGYIPSGQGAAHFYGILELLATTDYHIWQMFEDMLSKNVTKTLLISMLDDNINKLNGNINVLLGRDL